ncbi:MAG: hypothetical protein HFF70_07210 [Oscillospiraceae bacterium]|jgi:hypothetical protein|nr:hypothetical protein [Oscillospiraceae bacterium]
METYRLKNIAIVILLLLNGCLLLTVGFQELQALRAERRAEDRLRELYRASQLALGEDLDLSRQSLGALTPSRHAETERAIAAALLGGEPAAASQGGGIYSYEAEHGVIQFRSGGSFYGTRLDLPVEDIEGFAEEFCRRFGYEAPLCQMENGRGVASAIQLAGEVSVANCGVEMHFEGGRLTSVSGAHVSMEGAVPEPGARMTCVTALMKFLDHRNASGAVCSEVRDVRCVYQLRGASTPRLLPVWEIRTDTYTYYVDCETGEVTGR